MPAFYARLRPVTVFAPVSRLSKQRRKTRWRKRDAGWWQLDWLHSDWREPPRPFGAEPELPTMRILVITVAGVSASRDARASAGRNRAHLCRRRGEARLDRVALPSRDRCGGSCVFTHSPHDDHHFQPRRLARKSCRECFRGDASCRTRRGSTGLCVPRPDRGVCSAARDRSCEDSWPCHGT